MSRKIISIIISIIGLTAFASGQSGRLVYVLPIQEEINPTTWLYTRQGCEEALKLHADLLIIHLNTYGGSLQEADSIRTAIMRFPAPTIAFIDHNAASAGALIALACDSVFMTEGASMGAATVVGADGAPLPDKYQSYMRSMMRSTAEAHGKRWVESDSAYLWWRDPLIAEAMVDPRITVPGLVDSTKVLSFTPNEAIEWGYADGTASSINDLLEKLEYHTDNTRISTYQPTFTSKLLGFLGSAAVQAFLIMIIVGGIYFELKSPGLGFPAAAAIIAAILYFLPMCITGTVSAWVIIMFITGIISIAFEIFVIPGFGIAGICGILAIASSIIIALIQKETVIGVTLSDVAYACLIFFIGLAMALALIWYLSSEFAPKLVKHTVELQRTQQVRQGYIGVDMSPSRHIGQTAVTRTDMRPSGKIMLDGEVYDAVAAEGFIEAGQKVHIIRYENAQLYVTTIEKK